MNYCLITGASKGIGASLAHICAQHKHNLVLVARSADLLQKQAQELQEKYPIQVEVIACDLALQEAPHQIVETLQQKGIRISLLINNAGLGTCGPFVEATSEKIAQQIQVNMHALTMLTHLLLPHMIADGAGRILNIASTAAFQPGPYMSVYFATKAYVLSFSEGLRHELRGTGVTITTHCPGPTESAFAAEAGNDKTMLFAMGTVASSEAVAQHAYSAMMRGKAIAVQGWSNKIGALLVPFVPRWLTQRVATFLNTPR